MPRHLARLHIVGTGDSHQAEEDEDENLAEPSVAKRPGPAGVGDRREDRSQPNRHDRPATDIREIDPNDAGECERSEQAHQHLPLGQQSQLCDAWRTNAGLIVRAAPKVRQVIREVRANLQCERSKQRRERRPQIEDVIPQRDRATDSDRSHGGGQRWRTRGNQPRSDRAGADRCQFCGHYEEAYGRTSSGAVA